MTGNMALDFLIALAGVVFVGGPIAGLIAWRKDKREEPRDKVDTLQRTVDLAGAASAAAIEAMSKAAAAHARASNAEANVAQAIADVARVQSNLDHANHHSAEQDATMAEMRVELDTVKARLKSWINWGRLVHDEWASLREHMTPPPLPDDLTD